MHARIEPGQFSCFQGAEPNSLTRRRRILRSARAEKVVPLVPSHIYLDSRQSMIEPTLVLYLADAGPLFDKGDRASVGPV